MVRSSPNTAKEAELPVAEVQAGEDDGLQLLLLDDGVVRHVPHQQVHEDHVGGVDEGDVLQREVLVRQREALSRDRHGDERGLKEGLRVSGFGGRISLRPRYASSHMPMQDEDVRIA